MPMPILPNPFDGDGEWLRCALHSHTTNSDGDRSPAEVVKHYADAGFDVLFLTDHWVRTVEPSPETMLEVPSAELNATVTGSGLDAHVLALGIGADPELPDGDFVGLPETVAWVLAQGGVPYLAHTYWSGLRTAEFESCEGLVGVEVWNAACELETGRGLAALHWDEALGAGRLLYALATDDSHHQPHDSVAGWIWARCSERSAAAVLAALSEGSFYSSAGPEIEAVEVTADAVGVRCSPARSVTLVTSRWEGARANAERPGYPGHAHALETNDRGEIVAVRLERPALARYGRVEVEDSAGRRAWTNPLWI